MNSRNLGAFLESLEEDFPSERVIPIFPLNNLTTYGGGGPADLFIKVDSHKELELLIPRLRLLSAPLLLIGNGSNILISDEGFKGVALQLGETFEEILIEDTTVKAGVASKLPVVARKTVNSGLAGFEWAVGVPGTIGGAVRMNAGGHGADMAASLIEVKIADISETRKEVFRSVSLSELNLSYRGSSIKNTDLVVEATLRLNIAKKEDSEQLLKEIVRWRRENQPGGKNSGSVFTNPDGDSAGRLIEAAGLKGFKVGSASVSEKHANFIQVEGNGSAKDV